MTLQPTASTQRYLTYTGLTGLFFALLGIVTQYDRRNQRETRLSALDLVQLAFATFRLGRLVAYDHVMAPYRQPFTEVVLDDYGASETVHPKGDGLQRALGELICCPICTGTWLSALMVYGLKLAPRPTRTLMAIMSAVGAAELLNAALEALQWQGELARKRVGQG